MQFNQCQLCHSPNLTRFTTRAKPVREYVQCSDCEFVQAVMSSWPSDAEERDRYEHHENVDSPGYRDFFQSLLKEVKSRVPSDLTKKGLDYGCGPFHGKAPFLVSLLLELGYSMDYYDPYFYPTQPQSHYDFVTCTEVIEHVQKPFEFLANVSDLLKNQGVLFLMTSPFLDKEHFEGWSYRRDVTHISFFTKSNLQILAGRCSLKLIHHNKNLFVFIKTKTP